MTEPGSLLRAFRSRNYSLFFAGQGLSLIGSFIQATALSWILYRLTGSPLRLGYLSALMQLPTLVVLPFAGQLADRYDRRRLLLATQSLFLLQAATLAALAWTGSLTVASVVSMGVVQSVLAALDGPPRLALVPRLVQDPGDLPAAISMNAALFNAARSVGPPIAGFLLAEASEAACFLANAASYLFVLGGLMMMRLPPAPAAVRRGPAGFPATLAYIRRTPALREVLLLTTAVNLVTMSVYVLLPVWAKDVLGAGPHGLGMLAGGIGLGALVGAVVVGSQRDERRLARVLIGSGFGVGGALILFSQARALPVSMALAFVVGLAIICNATAASTLLQMAVRDERRAGVMSVLLLSTYGSVPLGNLFGGSLASWFGPRVATLAGGIAALLVAAFFARRAASLTAETKRAIR